MELMSKRISLPLRQADSFYIYLFSSLVSRTSHCPDSANSANARRWCHKGCQIGTMSSILFLLVLQNDSEAEMGRCRCAYYDQGDGSDEQGEHFLPGDVEHPDEDAHDDQSET